MWEVQFHRNNRWVCLPFKSAEAAGRFCEWCRSMTGVSHVVVIVP